MICVGCQNERHEHCDNAYDANGKKRPKRQRPKTWCDCAHKTGNYVGQLSCNHYKRTAPGIAPCPSCGKDVKVELVRGVYSPDEEEANE